MDKILQDVVRFLFDFVLFYPCIMSPIWVLGAIYYYFHWEKKEDLDHTRTPELTEYPFVSIIVPCYNEGKHIVETTGFLTKLNYPSYEIILVDDGSTDNTAEQIKHLVNTYPQVRAIYLKENQGKATAMRWGSLAASAEFLVCIDGDAVLDPNCLHWLIKQFLENPRVGAVTGNPRVRNRTTLIGKIQIGEFSSIIGVIKRAQRIYGKIFTVSGVVAAFRKAALHDVGYWNTDMATEDVDISWKLQLRFWNIHFEPNALCWVLMPETLAGLYKQRLRWAQGGAEVFLRYLGKMLRDIRYIRMVPIAIEYMAGAIWAYCVWTITILFILGQIVDLPNYLQIKSIVPTWTGALIALICLIQFLAGFLIDRRFEKDVFHYYFWIIWYPAIYWLINAVTIVVALPKAIIRKKGKLAVWDSPDRGEHNE
ncbi:poly-beta-1,6-N-acetyl-D-glucosamine synthase [Desulfotalea psychrophila]|uniref:Poly-beta-1,6-N-acetyl-D-glucosamine synthase n=1 Tax=Desulfotalea psychrophila (strain LSv54 / DSM 12343) TaxID=177439 RepID=Q6AMQ9_DESPS|nr:poly-beta-1,6-N-acetyl-D-glucosamine synthase [Desulfotalea psychrophila]CAG36366.1 conserved hypothetical membrane protein [Desulfotalea psychrophila LSv54]